MKNYSDCNGALKTFFWNSSDVLDFLKLIQDQNDFWSNLNHYHDKFRCRVRPGNINNNIGENFFVFNAVCIKLFVKFWILSVFSVNVYNECTVGYPGFYMLSFFNHISVEIWRLLCWNVQKNFLQKINGFSRFATFNKFLQPFSVVSSKKEVLLFVNCAIV